MGATIIIAIVYVLSALITYILDVYKLWELALVAVPLFPLYLYLRHQPKVWNAYFLLKEMGLFLRVMVLTFVYPNAKYVIYPISLDNESPLQFAGLISVGEVIIWLLVIIVVAYATNKSCINKCDNDVIVPYIKRCKLMNNTVSMTAILCAGIVLECTFVYNLEQFLVNMIFNIIIIIIMTAASSVMYRALVNERVKTLLEAEKK